ncbi:tRNA pseudouridine synthase 1, partial [Globomyces sp. JEL0801]
ANGQNSIEATLFKALSKAVNKQLAFTHISRAATTMAGEHAAKQCISLSIKDILENELPSTETINSLLPNDIRVFKIIVTTNNFSARRNCEARTFEYLIPSYAFSPPPEATLYCNPPLDDTDDPLPTTLPKGGLFDTLKKSSLSRRNTFKQSPELDTSIIAPSVANSDDTINQPQKPTKISCFGNFKQIFKRKSTPRGSAALKASLKTTLTRPTKTTDGNDENIVTTLHRSLSRGKKSTKQVFDDDIKEREELNTGRDYSPLDIPPPTESQKQDLKAYRMSPEQYKAVTSSLALFNGTHNFHNYIPGSVQTDHRCFIQIFNIEASPLEIHNGLEWIRVKIVGRSFGREQIRRMMGMLIMTIRTHTPRSVLGNSFGYTKIDIPEAPTNLILDSPHYNTYNFESISQNTTPVNFGSISAISDFNTKLLISIFETESIQLEFEAWLRHLDSYSFMYTHYLNSDGIISKPKNFPNVNDLEY